MTYLDTHIVVWLYAGQVGKFSRRVKALMNEHEIYISPIVRLELHYLYEIQRVTDDANAIVADLSNRIGLKVCGKNFNAIVNQAMKFSWTRDPFDRIIVANAGLNNNVLISKDQNILEHYPYTRW
ncbi:MAG TPA: type II toxin-antitoxin system VapC family toxin [Chloroflexi bacterium]|nr:MAG: transposase [Anaerolineaceae bacterium 4572_5.2]HEY84839.1 type II toxin-antitoxin system VapC family toxin [Chloroflexota bacterium]